MTLVLHLTVTVSPTLKVSPPFGESTIKKLVGV